MKTRTCALATIGAGSDGTQVQRKRKIGRKGEILTSVDVRIAIIPGQGRGVRLTAARVARRTDTRRTCARPAIPVTPSIPLALPCARFCPLPRTRVRASPSPDIHRTTRRRTCAHVGAIRKVRLRAAKPIRVGHARQLNHAPHPGDATLRRRMVSIHRRPGGRRGTLLGLVGRIGGRVVRTRVRTHGLRVPAGPAHAQRGVIVAFRGVGAGGRDGSVVRRARPAVVRVHMVVLCRIWHAAH